MAESVDVSALAIQAKDDPALLAPLWEAVQRLVRKWASGFVYETQDQGTRLFEKDDLEQVGYFAMLDAVAKYDPERGAKFTTYMVYYVRRHFRRVAGVYGTKVRPENIATSLDAPLFDEDDITGMEILADPNAEYADDVIERETLSQDCTELLAEIDKLPDGQRQALRLTAWDNLTLDQAAARMGGISGQAVQQNRNAGAENVRKSETGRRIQRERYNIKRVGLPKFKTTFTSEVEAHILQMEYQGRLGIGGYQFDAQRAF